MIGMVRGMMEVDGELRKEKKESGLIDCLIRGGLEPYARTLMCMYHVFNITHIL